METAQQERLTMVFSCSISRLRRVQVMVLMVVVMVAVIVVVVLQLLLLLLLASLAAVFLLLLLAPPGVRRVPLEDAADRPDPLR
jgi:Ca2+/Na+ antiporter